MCIVKYILLLILARINKGHLILILLLFFSHRGFQNFLKSQDFYELTIVPTENFLRTGVQAVFQPDVTSPPEWKFP